MTIHRRALATGALGPLAGAAGLSARPGLARTQGDWPARPVTMVVP